MLIVTAEALFGLSVVRKLAGNFSTQQATESRCSYR